MSGSVEVPCKAMNILHSQAHCDSSKHHDGYNLTLFQRSRPCHEHNVFKNPRLPFKYVGELPNKRFPGCGGKVANNEAYVEKALFLANQFQNVFTTESSLRQTYPATLKSHTHTDRC